MPRRIPDYTDQLITWNYISSIGSGLTIISLLMMVRLQCLSNEIHVTSPIDIIPSLRSFIYFSTYIITTVNEYIQELDGTKWPLQWQSHYSAWSAALQAAPHYRNRRVTIVGISWDQAESLDLLSTSTIDPSPVGYSSLLIVIMSLGSNTQLKTF